MLFTPSRVVRDLSHWISSTSYVSIIGWSLLWAILIGLGFTLFSAFLRSFINAV